MRVTLIAFENASFSSTRIQKRTARPQPMCTSTTLSRASGSPPNQLFRPDSACARASTAHRSQSIRYSLLLILSALLLVAWGNLTLSKSTSSPCSLPTTLYLTKKMPWPANSCSAIALGAAVSQRIVSMPLTHELHLSKTPLPLTANSCVKAPPSLWPPITGAPPSTWRQSCTANCCVARKLNATILRFLKG